MRASFAISDKPRALPGPRNAPVGSVAGFDSRDTFKSNVRCEGCKSPRNGTDLPRSPFWPGFFLPPSHSRRYTACGGFFAGQPSRARSGRAPTFRPTCPFKPPLTAAPYCDRRDSRGPVHPIAADRAPAATAATPATGASNLPPQWPPPYHSRRVVRPAGSPGGKSPAVQTVGALLFQRRVPAKAAIIHKGQIKVTRSAPGFSVMLRSAEHHASIPPHHD